MVVDLHRSHAGLARDVAAYHEDDAELADRVRKSQDGSREKSGQGQRYRYRKEGIQRRGAQRSGHLQRSLAYALERGLQGLHHERQRIEHGSNYQTPEGERQQADAQRFGQVTDRPIRPHAEQQVETQHGWRQHQRQGHDRAYRPFPPGLGTRQPPGNRGSHKQQDQGDDARQPDGQPDGLQVTIAQVHVCLSSARSFISFIRFSHENSTQMCLQYRTGI